MKRDDILEQTSAELNLGLTGPALDRLRRYAVLLRDRAAPLGFISPRDASDVLRRHVVDCLRAAPYVPSAGVAIDLGSGAGLPGVPVAIARPDVTVIMTDSQRRRVAFLELVCEELRLPNAVPSHARVEGLRGRAETCLARAFAPLAGAWSAAVPLLEAGGSLVFFAGASADIEGDRERLSPPPHVFRTVAPPRPLASSGPLVIMTVQ